MESNEKLLKIFDNNNYLLYLYVRHTYWKNEDNLEKKLQEHARMIEAVKNNDSASVEKLLREHYNEHYENTEPQTIDR